jgi:gamma-glutamylputrescine oxidase
VLIGANGYLGDLDRAAAAAIMPINSFIVTTEPLDDPEALIAERMAVADSNFVVNYYRVTADNRLLFGGAETYGYRFPDDIASRVRRNMTWVFPQLAKARIDYAWGGTLAITRNRLPYVRADAGRIVAGGYSGHGVALATMMGRLMGRAVLGEARGLDTMALLRPGAFPGGTALRHPLLVLAMSWYAMRDRLGM